MAKQPLWSTAVQLGTSAMISILIFLSFRSLLSLQIWIEVYQMWAPILSLFVQNVASWYLEVDCCWSRALPGNWHQLIQKIAASQGRESTIGAATKLNQNHRAFESFSSGHLLEASGDHFWSRNKIAIKHFVRHSFQTKLSIQPSLAHYIYVFKTLEMKCKSRLTKNAVVALECESL